MDSSEQSTRLNQINTLWSVVRQAHSDSGDTGRQARAALLARYNGAIHRYLLGVMRDTDAADDLAQEFSCRFLHGDLRGADRDRGRFRDFVKGVLFHMVADYHNKRKRQPGNLSPDAPEPGIDCSLAAEREEAFRTSWRDELLARTWSALKAEEETTGQPYYTVLRFRADNPDLASAQMAEQLAGPLGKSLTAVGVRKTLERARDRFADMLLDEIAQALDDASRDRLEEELIDLGLLEYCRPALARWSE
jgi:DNA-directed RNA polymerase specialized sigma24 family protein